MNMEYIPKFLMLLSYFLIYSSAYFLQLFKNRDIQRMYKTCENLSNYLVERNCGIDFGKLQVIYNFLLFLKILIITTLFVMIMIEYYEESSVCYFLFFNYICEFCESILTVHMSVTLIGLKFAAEKINELIRSLKTLELFDLKIILNEFVMFHLELYEMCMFGNKLFSFLIIKLFAILAAFLFSLHKFYYSSGEVLWKYDAILLGFHKFSCIFIIITSAVITPNKVRIKKYEDRSISP